MVNKIVHAKTTNKLNMPRLQWSR